MADVEQDNAGAREGQTSVREIDTGEQSREIKVRDIRPGNTDFAGYQIQCVYSYDPPDYAVYRNNSRIVVQFADKDEVAREQRTRISCLAALRGQINGLIDGWHCAADGDSPEAQARNPNFKRAARYDRRVADAIIIGLEGDTATALSLLAQIKNDIISERTSMARADYLGLAFGLALLVLVVMGFVARDMFGAFQFFPETLRPIWTAISGGTVGAFFSIAIGLKGRTVLIDLQNRDNRCDAFLRISIGAIAGAILLCLLLSGLASAVVNTAQLRYGQNYSDQMVFVISFLAGFFERLVPDLLDKTNLGTEENTGTEPGSGAPSGTPTARPQIADEAAGPAVQPARSS